MACFHKEMSSFPERKAFLVRVGIDSSYGGWNAPVNPNTLEFAYVPIPEEHPKKAIRPGYERSYQEFKATCTGFSEGFPERLLDKFVHLDPDFEYLTYGDENLRGRPLLGLLSGDILAFYAALRPIKPIIGKLTYALIGLYIVDRVMPAKAVPEEYWHKNAHTRRQPDPTDIVVFGKEGLSGRLERCIPIGQWRRGAYRVTEELLHEWGGLKVKDGWIQRSWVLPRFLDPQKFYDWFKKQKIGLISKNNLLAYKDAISI